MIDEVKTNYVRVLTTKYADFGGRANRKEFWQFVLANLSIQMVLGFIVSTLWFLVALDVSIVAGLFGLATLVPSLAIAVRRLHDIDRTGWWELMGFVPVVGGVTLLVMYCLPGSEAENRFGHRPKEITRDPEYETEQAERDLEASVNKLKQACVESLAAEKTTEAELLKKTTEIETLEKRATLAVNNGDDDMARQCLAQKMEVNAAAQALTAQLQSQKETTSSLKAKYSDLQEQLRVFRQRRADLKARAQAAAAQETTNKSYSGGSASTSNAMDKFEEKLRATEAKNAAQREMAQANSAASAASASEKNLDLEDELAAMKRTVAASKQEE